MQMISTGAALGVDIEGIDLAGKFDTETINAIKTAWAKHLVLRFRGQNLRDEDLLWFSRYFGLWTRRRSIPTARLGCRKTQKSTSSPIFWTTMAFASAG